MPIATSPTVFETTDATGNTSTSYTLAIGSTAQGTLTAGDHDFYRVNLVAGQTYSVAMTGTGVNNVKDTLLKLYASDGLSLLASNDDGLPGNNSTLTFTATSTGSYYLDAAAFTGADTGQYGVSVTAGARNSFDLSMAAGVIDGDASWSATAGTGTVVTYGFRQSAASYTVTGSNITTFTQVSAAERAAVQLALQLWSDASGIVFQEVNAGGFTDSATILIGNYTDSTDGAGAFAYYPGSTAAASSAGDVWLNTTSISTTSAAVGSFSFFAIMHELGHALGLSHPGSYNASPGVSITYANSAQFDQDSQQYSIMSYFDEANTGAAYNFANTPQMADVLAVQNIYGTNTATRAGDTVYGYNSNITGTLASVYNFSLNTTPAFTIWDGGGIDTLDGSGYTGAQRIDLTAGSFSNMRGSTNNIAIAAGAVIENAVGGSGADTLVGNAANNRLSGNAGTDTLDLSGNATFGGNNGAYVDLGGGAVLDGFGSYDTLLSVENVIGTDSLYPGFAPYSDLMFGSAATNIIEGRGGNDYIEGFGGADELYGQTGNDILSGGDGSDVLVFGTGSDYVFGGTGSDAFYIQVGDLRAGDYDTIVDFVVGQDFFAVSASLSGQVGVYEAAAGVVLMYAYTAGGTWYQQVYGTGVSAAAITAALFYV
jgi:serralysin